MLHRLPASSRPGICHSDADARLPTLRIQQLRRFPLLRAMRHHPGAQAATRACRPCADRAGRNSRRARRPRSGARVGRGAGVRGTCPWAAMARPAGLGRRNRPRPWARRAAPAGRHAAGAPSGRPPGPGRTGGTHLNSPPQAPGLLNLGRKATGRRPKLSMRKNGAVCASSSQPSSLSTQG